MNLLTNPLFVTYHRLARRAGIWPMMCIVILAGSSLIYVQERVRVSSLAEDEKGSPIAFYLGVLGAQLFILGVAWMTRVAACIALERKEGVLETNWLTPQKPGELAWGYLFGPPAVSFYAYAATLPISLIVAMKADLPLGFWVATQILVFATSLLAGLVGLVGGAAGNTAGGGLTFLLLFPSIGLSFLIGTALPSFVLPTHLAWELYVKVAQDKSLEIFPQPNLFSFEIPSAILTPIVVAVAYAWLWVSARRKFADPHRPALSGWMATLLYAMIFLTQHGLVWHFSSGRFPAADAPNGRDALSVIHVAAMVLGMMLVGTHCLNPFGLRISILGGRAFGFATLFRRSGVWLAIRLGLVGAAALLTQCYASLGENPWPFLLASANLLLVLTTLALILETSILWFGTYFMRVASLGILLLYFLPLLLGFTVENGALYSLLVPGVYVLAQPQNDDTEFLKGVILGHGMIVLALLVAWRYTWSVWVNRHCQPRPA